MIYIIHKEEEKKSKPNRQEWKLELPLLSSSGTLETNTVRSTLFHPLVKQKQARLLFLVHRVALVGCKERKKINKWHWTQENQNFTGKNRGKEKINKYK